MKNLIIASGYFNPLSFHHLLYLKESKNYYNEDNELFVIINNDKQVKLKKSIPFQDEFTRYTIISNLKYVTDTIISIDEDESVSKTIEFIYNTYKLIHQKVYFTNGGPYNPNAKELDICQKLNISYISGVGGQKKIESSSWIIERAAKAWIKKWINEDES